MWQLLRTTIYLLLATTTRKPNAAQQTFDLTVNVTLTAATCYVLPKQSCFHGRLRLRQHGS